MYVRFHIIYNKHRVKYTQCCSHTCIRPIQHCTPYTALTFLYSSVFYSVLFRRNGGLVWISLVFLFDIFRCFGRLLVVGYAVYWNRLLKAAPPSPPPPLLSLFSHSPLSSCSCLWLCSNSVFHISLTVCMLYH